MCRLILPDVSDSFSQNWYTFKDWTGAVLLRWSHLTWEWKENTVAGNKYKSRFMFKVFLKLRVDGFIVFIAAKPALSTGRIKLLPVSTGMKPGRANPTPLSAGLDVMSLYWPYRKVSDSISNEWNFLVADCPGTHVLTNHKEGLGDNHFRDVSATPAMTSRICR